MNSFIPWVGGKGKLLWIINKMAPYHYRRFIDVFGGSGTVTMNRPIRHGCMEVYDGRPIGISDVLELYDEGGSEFYYCDRIGFQQIEFAPQQEMNMNL